MKRNMRPDVPAESSAPDLPDAPDAPGFPDIGRASAEEEFESLITALVLSNAIAMSDAERNALFERILSGEGVTLERDGDWVEIHLVGKTIATLDLHWLVRKEKTPEAP